MTSIAAALKKWESKNEGVEIAQATEVKLYCQIPPIQRMDATLAGLSSVEHLSLSTNQIDRISGLRGLECLRTLSLGRNNIRSLAVCGDFRSSYLSYDLARVAVASLQLRRIGQRPNRFVDVELRRRLEGFKGGLDDVAETLEQLWVSYNQISSLDGLQSLSKLETLYMSNNSLSWDELDKLKVRANEAGDGFLLRAVTHSVSVDPKDLPCLQNVVFKGSLPTDGMDEAQYRVEILKVRAEAFRARPRLRAAHQASRAREDRRCDGHPRRAQSSTSTRGVGKGGARLQCSADGFHIERLAKKRDLVALFVLHTLPHARRALRVLPIQNRQKSRRVGGCGTYSSSKHLHHLKAKPAAEPARVQQAMHAVERRWQKVGDAVHHGQLSVQRHHRQKWHRLYGARCGDDHLPGRQGRPVDGCDADARLHVLRLDELYGGAFSRGAVHSADEMTRGHSEAPTRAGHDRRQHGASLG
eukprot:scaffold300_cov258-Pinguiococcus_pyrenoidosus.AAC.40